ncbi:hypothetical protein PENTCL1PPCAC_4461, partial [Pristionchus entomophagus]
PSPHLGVCCMSDLEDNPRDSDRDSRTPSPTLFNEEQLAGALVGLDTSIAETKKATKDFTTKVNRCFKTVTTRIDHCLPMVASLDAFPIRKEGRAPLRPFSGDGDEDFDLWIRRFNDLVNMASTALNDRQKASHLIGNLTSRARDVVDTLRDNQKVDHAAIIDAVRNLVQCPEERALARQRLNNCRQEPGESVQVFHSRLQRLVRSAMQGKDNDVVKDRILEEFMDRLSPRISFYVKSQVVPQYLPTQPVQLVQQAPVQRQYHFSQQMAPMPISRTRQLLVFCSAGYHNRQRCFAALAGTFNQLPNEDAESRTSNVGLFITNPTNQLINVNEGQMGVERQTRCSESGDKGSLETL